MENIMKSTPTEEVIMGGGGMDRASHTNNAMKEKYIPTDVKP